MAGGGRNQRLRRRNRVKKRGFDVVSPTLLLSGLGLFQRTGGEVRGTSAASDGRRQGETLSEGGLLARALLRFGVVNGRRRRVVLLTQDRGEKMLALLRLCLRMRVSFFLPSFLPSFSVCFVKLLVTRKTTLSK